jgi:nickel transport protein
MDLFSTFCRHKHEWWPVIGMAGLTCLLASGVNAHELEAEVSFAAPAVVVRAAYGGSDPVAFVKVQVFSPSSPSQEFQTGLTDRRGYFSFVPAVPGTWRVVIDDEQGHRRDVSVTIPQPFGTNTSVPATSPSRLERALTGIAFLVGATGFLYGFKARRSSG